MDEKTDTTEMSASSKQGQTQDNMCLDHLQF